jgi:hypothetical protein
VSGPEIPLVEECFGLIGRLVEEILESEADLVSAGGFQMGAGDVQSVELFPLAVGAVLGVLEPDAATADEFGTFCSIRRTFSTAVLTRLTMWNLSKVTAALGRFVVMPLKTACDMSALTSVTASGSPPWA